MSIEIKNVEKFTKQTDINTLVRRASEVNDLRVPVREVISNGFDGKQEREYGSPCTVAIILHRQWIIIEHDGGGRSRIDFKQQVIGRSKKAGKTEFIGRFALGELTHASLADKTTYISRPDLRKKPVAVRLNSERLLDQEVGEAKLSYLQHTGEKVIFEKLKTLPTKKGSQLTLEKLLPFLGSVFIDRLVTDGLRIFARVAPKKIDLQTAIETNWLDSKHIAKMHRVTPPDYSHLPVLMDVETHLPDYPERKLSIKLHFQEGGGGIARILGHTFGIEIRSIESKSLSRSILGSDAVTGYIIPHEGCINPNSNRDGYANDGYWQAFLEVLQKVDRLITQKVDQLRQQVSGSNSQVLHVRTIQIANNILGSTAMSSYRGIFRTPIKKGDGITRLREGEKRGRKSSGPRGKQTHFLGNLRFAEVHFPTGDKRVFSYDPNTVVISINRDHRLYKQAQKNPRAMVFIYLSCIGEVIKRTKNLDDNFLQTWNIQVNIDVSKIRFGRKSLQ